MWERSNAIGSKIQPGLKPQDILVLLKILASGNREWRLVDLGIELGLSQSEVSMALDRARRSGFIVESSESPRKLVKSALEEFLLHGLKYVFPAELGALCRGIPTAHSFEPLVNMIVSNENDQYVWQHPDGQLRGQALSPLCDWAPDAARKDAKLHELLALVDALRIGRARERSIAAEELKKRIYAA